MRIGRRLAGIAIAGGLSTVLAGCVVIQGPVKVKQVGTKPKATVTFKLCNSDGDAPSPICPDPGNAEDSGASSLIPTERVLLGIRVPRGTGVPNRIRPLSPKGEVFRSYGRYTRELNRAAPQPRGTRWFGFQAYPEDVDTKIGNDYYRYEKARVRIRLRVPEELVGKRFGVRPVVGWFDNFGQDAGLDCGPDPFERYSDGYGEYTICIDSPSRAETRKSVRVKIKP